MLLVFFFFVFFCYIIIIFSLCFLCCFFAYVGLFLCCSGMANAENSTSLLKWHALLVEKAGLGCIIRAFAERKTVV
jgi:hypothetical protein